LARNVVMHRVHRIPYDRAIELAGGRIVEIGNTVRTFDWELDSAIDSGTAAVFWVAGSHLSQTALSLPRTISIAHAHDVPVIVDAAAQLPPVTNLWHFSRDLGADLVLFSGGKGLRGPQSSGLMLGRHDLVAAARVNGPPNQYLARALKVGKEEMCGLLAAVENYLGLDHDAVAAACEAIVANWVTRLGGLPGISALRSFPSEAGQALPRLRLLIDADVAGLSADQLVARLWDRTPRVAVARGEGESVYVAADTLAEPGEEAHVLAALMEVLTGQPAVAKRRGR
jgi:L-seryl-tRNA(Ser) seleniumtransferase